MTRGERALLVAAPVGAIAAVAVGLGLGGHGASRAALVYAAPPGPPGTGLAWQLVVLQEERGVREPLPAVRLDVTATSGSRVVRWQGTTNGDGVAEMALALPGAQSVHLVVRAGSELLADGDATVPDVERSTPASPWLRFARREGPVLLDVAVVGERAAPGFPARLWVRASDSKAGVPLEGVDVTMAGDPSLVLSVPEARTDSGGWAELVTTPVGLAVTMALHAQRGALGGEWIGGLFMSPGGSRIETHPRWGPDEDIEVEVQSPVPRSMVYLEVDGAGGRAWATAPALVPPGSAMPSAVVRVPRLAPGLYWAVASNDPAGAAALGAGTTVRPFFVARSDEEALALGARLPQCKPAPDPREEPRAIASCLALATTTPLRRWRAIEGFSSQRARDERRRARGIAVGLGALGIAVLLEAVLLLRTAATTRTHLAIQAGVADGGAAPGLGSRGWNLAVTLLVVLLGFALLGAFLARLA